MSVKFIAVLLTIVSVNFANAGSKPSDFTCAQLKDIVLKKGPAGFALKKSNDSETVLYGTPEWAESACVAELGSSCDLKGFSPVHDVVTHRVDASDVNGVFACHMGYKYISRGSRNGAEDHSKHDR